MDAQIAVAVEIGQHRIGDTADAHLQGGTIGNHAGNKSADFAIDPACTALGGLGQGVIRLHNVGEPADVDEAIAMRAGHVGVDFGDDNAGRFGRWFGRAHLYAKRAKAVFIGWGE